MGSFKDYLLEDNYIAESIATTPTPQEMKWQSRSDGSGKVYVHKSTMLVYGRVEAEDDYNATAYVPTNSVSWSLDNDGKQIAGSVHAVGSVEQKQAVKIAQKKVEDAFRNYSGKWNLDNLEKFDPNSDW
jgi:hypothetical protein